MELPLAPVLEATGISAAELRVLDADGQPVTMQVVVADPADRSRDVLVLRLNEPIPAGTDDYGQTCAYLTLERAPSTPGNAGGGGRSGDKAAGKAARANEPIPAAGGESSNSMGAGAGSGDAEYAGLPVAHEERGGVRLRNRYLNLWMDLGNGGPWYSGAATSMVVTVKDNPYLRGTGGVVPWWLFTECVDILDTYTGMVTAEGHDPEKRCMQIDRVRLSLPATAPEPELVHELVGTRYTLLGCSTGPLRAAVAIASEPFDYPYTDPLTGELRTVALRLHRLISLDADADHVLEEVSLRPGGAAAGKAPLPYFIPRYFAFMDMGREPLVTHFPHIPDWFSASVEGDPNQGYGFATDMHCAPVQAPHRGYPLPKNAHKTFSWELGSGQIARCLHLFRFCPAAAMAEETGRAWYTHIYKPLRARLENQGEE